MKMEIEGVFMGLLRPDMIILHRVDNGEKIYVKSDSVVMIEPGAVDGSSFVYVGEGTRVRAVKESPEEVRRMVERTA